MKNLALIAAAAVTAGMFGAGAIAVAQESTTDFTKADANNDAMVSFDEARGPFPTLTEDLFKQADANGDGNLDEAEFTSLIGLTAGLDGQGGDSSSQAPAPATSSSEGNDGTSTPSSSSSSAQ